MFNLLTLAFGVIAIVSLAKLNKSNKLFWTLLVSMLIGYAGGSLISKFNSIGKQKTDTTYVVPMHASPSLTAISPALMDDILVVPEHTKHVGQYNDMSRDMVSVGAKQAFSPDYDIGNYDTENTS